MVVLLNMNSFESPEPLKCSKKHPSYILQSLCKNLRKKIYIYVDAGERKLLNCDTIALRIITLI